jgi:hypothetical protein
LRDSKIKQKVSGSFRKIKKVKNILNQTQGAAISIKAFNKSKDLYRINTHLTILGDFIFIYTRDAWKGIPQKASIKNFFFKSCPQDTF